MTDRRPARQRRKDARPQELLAAALDLFVEKGYAATRTEEVAARAGVAKGTVFLYYPSKDDLFKAVVRDALVSALDEGLAVLETYRGDTGSLLRLAVTMWWQRVGDSRCGGLCKLMTAEARNFPELGAFFAREVVEPGHALVERILTRGIERGEFRAVPVKEASVLVVAPLIYLSIHQHGLGACSGAALPIDIDRYVQTHIELLLHGLAAGSDEPRGRSLKSAPDRSTDGPRAVAPVQAKIKPKTTTKRSPPPKRTPS